jgi:hypothetical protein
MGDEEDQATVMQPVKGKFKKRKMERKKKLLERGSKKL